MPSNTEYKNQKAVDYILRCAIKEGGHAWYNPYMYDLGCADNIGPSEEFNNELRKYGTIHGMEPYDTVWSYFEINDYGRQYIASKEQAYKDSVSSFKWLRNLVTFLLSVIQLPCVIEGWISYFLNSIIKAIASCCLVLGLVSLLWWPIDMIFMLIWSSCDYLKYAIWKKKNTFAKSMNRFANIYPQL